MCATDDGLGHGAEPRLGGRRGLKDVADDQTRAAPRQPLAVREPRPTKFAICYLPFPPCRANRSCGHYDGTNLLNYHEIVALRA